MEDKLSTAMPNPSQPTTMSPSKSGQNNGNLKQETLESQPPNNQEPLEEIHIGANLPKGEAAEGDREEEDEGECGFCLFMKGGGCRDSFIEWEKCVEEGEKNKEDIVEKCFQVTSALKKCMEEHSEYYAPILQAERAAEAEAVEELEMEKEKEEEEEREKVNEGNHNSGSVASTKTVRDTESSEQK